MPGLYFHVPFCRQACSYCNFHFSTARQGHDEMVEAMARELETRASEMPAGPWSSVYLGGGTPSLLTAGQVERLLAVAASTRGIAAGAEVTLEANPDDLDGTRVEAFAKTPVNRLSIGVQSFREGDLVYMRRAHDARQAIASVARAREAGFDELTIDLIYGTPGLDDAAWLANLRRAVALGVPHISAYALTVEPKTALAHDIRAGRSLPVDEEQAARQMELLVDTLGAAGYEHYEVSNFALPGHRARHNSSYWKGEAYLGIGPSAHSFDGSRTRSWNVAHNARYLRAIEAGDSPLARETLTADERYNELLLTGLRTSWGVSLGDLAALGHEATFRRDAGPLIASGLLERIGSESEGSEGEAFRLTRAGRMRADGITAELFVVA